MRVLFALIVALTAITAPVWLPAHAQNDDGCSATYTTDYVGWLSYALGLTTDHPAVLPTDDPCYAQGYQAWSDAEAFAKGTPTPRPVAMTPTADAAVPAPQVFRAVPTPAPVTCTGSPAAFVTPSEAHYGDTIALFAEGYAPGTVVTVTMRYAPANASAPTTLGSMTAHVHADCTILVDASTLSNLPGIYQFGLHGSPYAPGGAYSPPLDLYAWATVR